MSIARVICLLPLLVSPGLASEGWTGVYEAARPAVFDVLINDRHAGTGFFVTSDGYAMTAAHVVPRNDVRIEALRVDGRRLSARVVARDLGHDVALLQVTVDRTPYLKLTKTRPEVGELVGVLGTPLMRRGLMDFGHLSRPTPRFEYLNGPNHFVECLCVSGMAPRGTSGGPWLNAEGHVFGVQSGAISLGQAMQGMAFVAPPASLARLMKQKRTVVTPTIGVVIEETWQQPTEFLRAFPPRTDGVVVKRFGRSATADEAGVKPGDVIVALDGKPIRFVEELLRAVRATSPGKTIRCELRGRKGEANRTVEVTVGALGAN